MPKFHVSHDGMARVCDAKIQCRLTEPDGSSTPHGEFANAKEAASFAEEVTAKRFGGSFNTQPIRDPAQFRSYEDFSETDMKFFANSVVSSQADGENSRRNLSEYLRNEYPGLDESARLDVVAEAHLLEVRLREAPKAERFNPRAYRSPAFTGARKTKLQEWREMAAEGSDIDFINAVKVRDGLNYAEAATLYNEARRDPDVVEPPLRPYAEHYSYDDFSEEDRASLADMVASDKKGGFDSRKNLDRLLQSQYTGLSESARADVAAQVHALASRGGVSPGSRSSMKNRLGAMVSKLRGFRKADHASQQKADTLSLVQAYARSKRLPSARRAAASTASRRVALDRRVARREEQEVHLALRQQKRRADARYSATLRAGARR